MNNFYVYIYLDPRKPGQFTYGDYSFEYEPFYIGKGSGDRINYHKYDHVNKLKFNLINKISKLGLEPIKIKIHENLDESTAHNIEKTLILLIGRRDKKLGPLTNLTDGGEGMTGVVFSKSELDRRSKAATGENNPMYGKATYGFKGKVHTSESIEDIRNKAKDHRALTDSPEYRTKLSEATKKSWLTRKSQSQRVIINNQIYTSIRAAAKEIGVSKDMISYKCKTNDPNFRYID